LHAKARLKTFQSTHSVLHHGHLHESMLKAGASGDHAKVNEIKAKMEP
jgi:hypothetical protein